MKMRKTNQHVRNTREQILNTLEIMSNCGLTRITKDVLLLQKEDEATLTWEGHTPGRHNAGKSFTTLNQYTSIYETGAYHCILFDGSIIRVYFKFKKNILTNESLLYWPAPIVIPEEDVDELGIREALDMYIASQDSTKTELRMRTPVRLDFDPLAQKEGHPVTHLHMQHHNCRISVNSPCCFNSFIKFVFMHFYPHIDLDFLHKLEPLRYSGFEVHQSAVVTI